MLLTTRVVLAAAAGAALSAAQPPPPPCERPPAVTRVTVAGRSNYEFGWALGKATALQVRARRDTPQFAEYAAFAATPAGAAAVAALNASAAAAFPAYVEELAGLADGAGVSFLDAFLFNVYDELDTAMAAPAASREDHCSDVLLPGEPRILAHNEDARRLNLGLMALVDGRVPRADGAGTLSFTAYNYAGHLPTGAFAFTGAGLFFTTNALFPVALNATGVPRNFAHRYVLEATGLDDALGRLASVRVACGFSINLGSTRDPARRLFNVELSAVASADVLAVAPGGFAVHTNTYRRSPTPQLRSPSSEARLAALLAQPRPAAGDAAGVWRLLGDTTTNATYPVWREGAPPDTSATLLTAAFIVDDAGGGGGTLALRTSNPLTCGEPPVVEVRFE